MMTRRRTTIQTTIVTQSTAKKKTLGNVVLFSKLFFILVVRLESETGSEPCLLQNVQKQKVVHNRTRRYYCKYNCIY